MTPADEALVGRVAGPLVKTVTTHHCVGCPALATKDWSFEGENDDIDSGTSAHCTKADKHIDSYWNEGRKTPEWCPALEAAKAPTPEPAGAASITALYTNWRGERAPRTFIPHRVFFGSNEWHPEPQVLIEGTDCVTGELRTFAAAGFAKAAPGSGAVASGGVEAEREACEAAIVSHVTKAGDDPRSDDYMLGFAAGANYTAERNAAALRARGQ